MRNNAFGLPLQFMCRVGNVRANARYEAKLAAAGNYTKPNRNTSKVRGVLSRPLL